MRASILTAEAYANRRNVEEEHLNELGEDLVRQAEENQRLKTEIEVLQQRIEHDPILGIVPLKLSDILETRSQVTRWYPLDGGIGFGHIEQCKENRSRGIEHRALV